MAFYEYICPNVICEDHKIIKTASMPMAEYTEDKLPKCNKCDAKTQRHYTAIGHQTFGDGYKG